VRSARPTLPERVPAADRGSREGLKEAKWPIDLRGNHPMKRGYADGALAVIRAEVALDTAASIDKIDALSFGYHPAVARQSLERR
jgi:hypothetical protein